MNDASNASALIALAVAGLLGASVGAVLGLIRWSRLEMQDQWTGADILDLPKRDCTCGAPWCPYTPNKAQKNWKRP